MTSLPSLSQKVLIIGAGIVGVNLADELLQRGWSDITVVDQGPLHMPGGSTSHAPGLVFQTNSSKSMSHLARYTVQKLLQLEKDGENCFDQIGGLEVATTPERLQELHRRHGWATSWGIEARLISPAKCLELYPLLNQDAVLGGLHIPSDGLAKAARAVQLLIERTEQRGVRYLGGTPVTGIQKTGSRVHGVYTPRGIIPADLVISCAGFWGVEIGSMAGVKVPLVPLAHQYVKTGAVPGLAKRQGQPMMPILRHQDQDLYYREHGGQYGIGYYGHRPMPVNAGALGITDEHVDEHNQPSRLPFTPDDFAPAWTESQTLLPNLKQSTISDGFNGIFSFTPDGGPLVGYAPNLDGFFIAEAIWVTHSAGVARAVAQLLTTGHSDIDMTECNISRFDEVQLSDEYVSETSQQNFVEVYDIIHPWQPKSSPRDLRVSPFYASQRSLGAFFVDVQAWERAEWYETNVELVNHLPAEWQPAARDAWSDRFYSAAAVVEAWKTRSAVGLFDLTSNTRVRVCGPGSVELLRRLSTGDVEKGAGNVTYALFLTPDGCIRGDATIARLGDTLFQLTVSSNIDVEYLTREASYQSQYNPSSWVSVENVSSGTCCIGLWGPSAHQVLRRVTASDFSDKGLPAQQCNTTSVAGVPVVAMRISDVGESGWELHTTADHGARLWDSLWQTGQPFGLVAAGRIAFVALRLEKGLRAFGVDMTAEHDPFEAGVEWAEHSDRRDFVGWSALQRRSKQRLGRRLRSIHVDDGRSVVMGKEPVFHRGKPVGYVTTAAFGYSIGRPIAHAWLPATISPGDTVEIGYFSRMISATVAQDGSMMKGSKTAIPDSGYRESKL